MEPDKVMKDKIIALRKTTNIHTVVGTRKCERCNNWFFWPDKNTEPRHCNNCAEEVGE